MKKIALGFVFYLCFCNLLVLVGQNAKKLDSAKVEVYLEPSVEKLLDLEKAIKEKRSGTIKGYRVQIHFGPDRDKAKELKAKFIQKYSDVTAYEEYDMPNFKIRVGDFRTKLDAYRFLKQLTADFPSSFIVQDDVELKEINK